MSVVLKSRAPTALPGTQCPEADNSTHLLTSSISVSAGGIFRFDSLYFCPLCCQGP